MARLTGADMLSIVRDSLGGETTETLSDTRVMRYINQSYLELCSFYQFDQLKTSTTITTTSGTADYELSVSTVLNIDDILDTTNNNKLYPMNDYQYNQFTQGGTQSGTPQYWFMNGVGSNDRFQITLWPTPAGTYSLTVDINKKPTELVASPLASATSPVIPEQWDDSIIYRAVARGWMMLGDHDTAAKWRHMARENDRAAFKTTYHPSYIKTRPGSIISKALRDV